MASSGVSTPPPSLPACLPALCFIRSLPPGRDCSCLSAEGEFPGKDMPGVLRHQAFNKSLWHAISSAKMQSHTIFFLCFQKNKSMLPIKLIGSCILNSEVLQGWAGEVYFRIEEMYSTISAKARHHPCAPCNSSSSHKTAHLR